MIGENRLSSTIMRRLTRALHFVALIVFVHPYCARNRHVMQMAIVITLRGFNDLGRSVTSIFLSMGHFLYQVSTFCEKMKKIYRVEV